MAGLETHYSARDIEARILAALRAAGLNPDQRLSSEELAALDHFHTGGLRASRELLELAQIGAGDRVLDIGAGLAGPARLLASARGCRVDCLDMSPDFCAGAELLNELTGLDDRVVVHEGSALDMPFTDDAFDVVWMQNVGMNIADKDKLYAEIGRVLKPGGRFAFQEMVAGEAAPSHFPLPWATDPTDSFLVSAEEMLSLLGRSGFIAETIRRHERRSFARDRPLTPRLPRRDSSPLRCSSIISRRKPGTRGAVSRKARCDLSGVSSGRIEARSRARTSVWPDWRDLLARTNQLRRLAHET